MAAPTVLGIDIASGPPGTMVVITGTNFNDTVSAVTFDTYSAGSNFTVLDEVSILAYVPAGTGVNKTVYVTNSDGTGSLASAWSWDTDEGGPGGSGGAAPTVTDLSIHTSASTDEQGGDSVTITGTKFTTAIYVWFGDTPASFTISSDISIVAVAPPGTGTVDVDVQNAYGRSVEPGDPTANNFTYPLPAAPTISTVAPSAGTINTVVTITGDNFSTASVVYFDVYTAAFQIISDESIRAYAPEGPSAGAPAKDVSVVTRGGTATSTGAFTYLATIVDLAGAAGTGSVTLTWSPVVSSSPVMYEVYGNDGVTPPTTLRTTTSQTSVTFQQAHSDGDWYYGVKVVDIYGNKSALSNIVQITSLDVIATTIAEGAIDNINMFAGVVRPPTLESSAPSLPDTHYPAGSVYYNTTDHYLYKTINGTTWTQLVGSGDIIAGSISAGLIGAGAVAAKHLFVGSFDNLISNGNSEQDTSALPADAYELQGVSNDYYKDGTRSRKLQGGVTYTTLDLTGKIPVQFDEQYLVSSWMRLGPGASAGNCFTQLVGYDSTGTENGVYYSPGTVTNNSAFEQKYGSYKILSGTAFISMRCVTYQLTSSYYAYFDQLILKRQADGKLIVDGAITATHIESQVLTGATIQTDDAGQRVVLSKDANTVQFYDSSNNDCGYVYGSSQYLQMNAGKVVIGAGEVGDYSSTNLLLSGAVTMGASRRAGHTVFCDFVGSAAHFGNGSDIDEWAINNLSDGGIDTPTMGGSLNHPGTIFWRTLATAGAGRKMATGVNTLYLTTVNSTYDYCEFTFMLETSNTNSHTRMGFCDWWTKQSSSDVSGYGAYFYSSGVTITGIVAINGTNSTTSDWTLTASTWYTGRVKCYKDGSGNYKTDFSIFNEDGSQNGSTKTVNYSPTASPVGHGYLGWTDDATARSLITMDYMSYYLSPRAR